MSTRPCGCPGEPGADHLDDDARAGLGLAPCPRRGARSGPSGKPRNSKRVRLTTGLAKAAAALDDAGRADEAEAALRALLP
jgi:hypothetical protein